MCLLACVQSLTHLRKEGVPQNSPDPSGLPLSVPCEMHVAQQRPVLGERHELSATWLLAFGERREGSPHRPPVPCEQMPSVHV